MQTIITLIVFLLILGTIIIIHEFGHFIAAKIFGVYCSHFSIGFGPKIWSKKGKETEYEIRAHRDSDENPSSRSPLCASVSAYG